jgi:hypothetical protein
MPPQAVDHFLHHIPSLLLPSFLLPALPPSFLQREEVGEESAVLCVVAMLHPKRRENREKGLLHLLKEGMGKESVLDVEVRGGREGGRAGGREGEGISPQGSVQAPTKT